jgi:hypothetical protein
VILSQDRAELEKLAQRFEQAQHDCATRGCLPVLEAFIEACNQSDAVFNVTVERLHRETSTGTDIYESFYDMERLRCLACLDSDFELKLLRSQAEIQLLGSDRNKDQIHYACTSLNGVSLASYGECTVTLAESMIAHRASCFEGNTAVIYHRDHSFKDRLRSNWPDRAKLAAAAFHEQVSDETDETDFPHVLVQDGNADEQAYVEVHVFGPMTGKTFKQVVIDGTQLKGAEKTYARVIQEKLGPDVVEVTN